MMDTTKHGPQYPAPGGAKITGNTTLCSDALGSRSGLATSDPTRIVTQGDPTVSATCVAVQPPSEPPTRETG